jgi:two-component sensor histidine kinase/ABC-type nitrate/sulfonate/bicarbonate transport system substrate-binding protein
MEHCGASEARMIHAKAGDKDFTDGTIILDHMRRVIWALLLGAFCVAAQAANDKVRLQLKWQHQFQFAGYYAAKANGYYQAAGLDVEIIPCQPGDDHVQNVLQGQAEFGVGATDLLLLREKGAPLVVLAVIFQHSPLALMTLKSKELQSIHDLAGRKLMIEPGSSELYAYLNKEGISADKFTLLPHDFSAEKLLAGKVDAMSAYVTDEPFEVSKAGQEYMLYSPRAVGIDFYGDNLFTSMNQLKLKPERVKAFLKASLQGWEYAMQHQEELVQLIYSQYSQGHSIDHLRFEARQMVPLLQAQLVEIGYMNPGRWRHIVEVYADLGMMKPDFNFKGFLYDPNPPPSSLRWLYVVMGIAILIITLVSALAVYIYRINVRLRQEAAERKLAESQREAALEALQTAFKENRNLLGELQHRAKNSFSMILGMISLASSPGVSAEIKTALADLDSRVRSVSELYSLLYSAGSFTEVRLDEYCVRIAAPLVGLSGNITLNTEMESIIVPVKEAAPLGLILTELLTNAGKYAFPGGRSGTITLALKKSAAGAILEVKDDGAGLPAGFNLARNAGMGINLVQALAGQINGSFRMESGAAGTRCIVEFAATDNVPK